MDRDAAERTKTRGGIDSGGGPILIMTKHYSTRITIVAYVQRAAERLTRVLPMKQRKLNPQDEQGKLENREWLARGLPAEPGERRGYPRSSRQRSRVRARTSHMVRAGEGGGQQDYLRVVCISVTAPCMNEAYQCLKSWMRVRVYPCWFFFQVFVYISELLGFAAPCLGDYSFGCELLWLLILCLYF